ncbi:MAG: lipid-A-disaccharide synthase [Desulfococcaceae bacterium]
MENKTSSVQKSVMIIAGEASGDLHGARLVKAMRKKNPQLSFFGIGGPLLRDAGVETFVDASELAVLGITEAFSRIRRILRAMSEAKNMLKKRRPDLLILIDLPDFNLRVAACAKRLGIKVLYYISPQIWAWRQGRVRIIQERTDHMAVILPFEESFYRKHRVKATFVGHPLLDRETAVMYTEKDFTAPPVIGILPGSREGEIRKLLPVMLESARILRTMIPEIRFVLSHPPSVSKDFLEEILGLYQKDLPLEMETGTEPVFEKCHFAIAVSGTVTLETALAGIPLVIIYKVSPVSYWLGRLLIKVPFISLVNLISGRQLVPELIQDDANPKNIAKTVLGMLKDIPGLIQLRQNLLFIRKRMGGSGASERTADIALNMLNHK